MSSFTAFAIWLAPVASADTLLFSDDFETIPSEPAENVPNVALGADGTQGEWYVRYNNFLALDWESEDYSVAVYSPEQGGNKWPDSDPERSSVLRVGFADDSVKSVISLDLEDKWDRTQNYLLRFQWAVAEHTRLDGRDFQVKIFGAPTYNLGFPGAPDKVRSNPTEVGAGGEVIKERQLDQGAGVTLIDTVHTEEILITGAEIEAASQHGSQIYFGFEKPAGTEFYMVDNVTFEEVGSTDPTDFGITEITYSPDAQPIPTVTLTWNKTDAASYLCKYSLDLSGWEGGWLIVLQPIAMSPPRTPNTSR